MSFPAFSLGRASRTQEAVKGLNPDQQRLVEANLGLAGAAARRWQRRLKAPWADFVELRSLCHVGLCRAALTFDPAKGAAFSTWASLACDSQVRDHVRWRRRRRRTATVAIVPNSILDSDRIRIRRVY
jgi:DNA-directed RNA polymerase specialized sigma subunit